jgi:hypothetical protein
LSYIASLEGTPERDVKEENTSMRNGCACQRQIKVLWAVALWPSVACAAEGESGWMARAGEIRFERRVTHDETTLHHPIGKSFGYFLAVRATAQGRSEIAGGPLVRPLKGLEIGLERPWEGPASFRHESIPLEERRYSGTGFDNHTNVMGLKPPPVNLGSTGAFKYELQGSRLRVKYHLNENTVVSVRARYHWSEQRAAVWLSTETRF